MEAFCWVGFSSVGILQEAFSCGGNCAWRDFASKPIHVPNIHFVKNMRIDQNLLIENAGDFKRNNLQNEIQPVL